MNREPIRSPARVPLRMLNSIRAVIV
jgi:hypothetical protein